MITKHSAGTRTFRKTDTLFRFIEKSMTGPKKQTY